MAVDGTEACHRSGMFRKSLSHRLARFWTAPKYRWYLCRQMITDVSRYTQTRNIRNNSMYRHVCWIDAGTLMQQNALSHSLSLLDLFQSDWGCVYTDACCFQGLPVVLLVGNVTIGRKLLNALGHAESGDTAAGIIKNKYYAARVQQPGTRLTERQKDRPVIDFMI